MTFKATKKNSISLTLDITCNYEGKADDAINFNNASNSNEGGLHLNATHYLGCPVLSISYIYEKYRYPILAVYIVLGIICAFFGSKFYKVALFLIGLIAGATLMFVILYQNWLIKPSETNVRDFWIALSISVVVGVTIGGLITYFNRFWFFIVGGILGGFGGFMLYSIVLEKFTPKVILSHNFSMCSIPQ